MAGGGGSEAGLKIEWKTKGTGAKPAAGKTVTVHCTGIVQATGKKFWSTKDPGQTTFAFRIGRGEVIKAWDEGVMQMGVGDHAVLTAPGHMAYGARGFPEWGIPPNATLIFEIELLKIS